MQYNFINKSSSKKPMQILNDVFSHCIIFTYNMEMHVPEKYYFEPKITFHK